MNQKRTHVLATAAAAIAILLLMIFWSRFSSRPEPGLAPRTESSTRSLLLSELVPPTEKLTVHDFGPPDEWHVAGAVGQTYTETLSGAGLRTSETGVLLGQSPPDGPYIDWYAVGRAYVGWDTSSLPDGAEVLSATLTLELPAGGGRAESFDIVVYRGDWTPPIDLNAWQSPVSQAVGRWHLPASRIEERVTLHTDQGMTLYALEPARTMRIPLSPAAIGVGGVTRLELRHGEEAVSSTVPEIISLERSQITLEVGYRP